MAEKVKDKKSGERRVLQCLICGLSTETLLKHLERVCMKDKSREERKEEAVRAKHSNESFNRNARLWSHEYMSNLIKDDEARNTLTKEMKERGFLFEEDMDKKDKKKKPKEKQSSFCTISQVFRQLLPTMEILKEDLEKDRASDGQRDDFRRFCESIILLKHFKPPKVVRDFTVSWNSYFLINWHPLCY